MNPKIKFTHSLLSLMIKSFFRNLLVLTIQNINHKYFIKIINTVLFLKKKKFFFGFEIQKDLYFIKEEKQQKHYFSNKERGFNLYYQGLRSRSKQIANSYLLDSINFEKEDIVIDCGANYGDLWLHLKNKIDPFNYITFEPGINEYKSLICNAPLSKNINKGLGDKEANINFYLNEKDADSSIIKPLKFDKIKKIKIIKLDDYIEREKIQKVKLLKIEAEGFEPEILKGCERNINKFSYIAIDGGNERGINLEETMSYQLNFLMNRGYQIKGINLNWGRALLYNSNR
tara:strand:- start:25401 stop:26261 length:861 start_codon:yes stop_codon:yes gene_type:complete